MIRRQAEELCSTRMVIGMMDYGWMISLMERAE
jgi:hypothetical protein